MVAAGQPSGLASGSQLERRRVDAVAQAGRVRAVLEDVAQVAAARRAHRLGPLHEERTVGFGLDRGLDRPGAKKLGQPVPDSNLVSDRNSPARRSRRSGRSLPGARPTARRVKARSVPFWRRTRYCSGVSSARHSASVLVWADLPLVSCMRDDAPDVWRSDDVAASRPRADRSSMTQTPGGQGRLNRPPGVSTPVSTVGSYDRCDHRRLAPLERRNRSPRASPPDPARHRTYRPSPPRRGRSVGGPPRTRPGVQPATPARPLVPHPVAHRPDRRLRRRADAVADPSRGLGDRAGRPRRAADAQRSCSSRGGSPRSARRSSTRGGPARPASSASSAWP